TVVGVMPPDFAFPVDSVRLWRPLSPAGAHASHFNAVGLLRAGVTFERAEEMTARTTRGLRDATGQPLPELRLLPLAPMSGRTRPVLLASIGAAALLLLIAVANVAQVLLGEALRREREMAVRSALGGSPTRLARQVIVEAGVLSVGAALLGLLLARAALPAFVSAVPWAISFFALRPIVIDARVLSCALVVTTLASVGAAAGPLWRLRDARTSFAPRTTGNTPGRGRLQGGLLVGQVALTTVLLMAAGLLGRSVIVLFERDIGFTPRPLLVVSVDLPGVLFPTAASRRALLDAWRQRVAGLPGVAAATVGEGSIPPSLGFRNGAIETADGGVFGDATTVVTEATVDDGYVATLGLPVLSGRAFDATDSAETQRVVMVSRALAERLWPAGDAVGRQVRLEPEESWSTVVGVVGNVRNGSQEQPLGDLALYWSRAQSPDPWRFQSLVLRVTDGSSRRLEPAVRQALRALNPDVPIADVQSGDDVVAEANVRLRFFTGLMSAIAIVALGLAIVGIYGSFLSAVRQQVGELGVRRVLGAEAPAIVRLVLGRAVRVALAGLTFGAPLAIATAGLLRGLLVELEPYDPATLASVALFLLAAALAAAFVPARFAGRIDPAVVLRHE
ncbi:MAG: FtsX-like permease family protein, partial [Vicinamibacterales bacterium]